MIPFNIPLLTGEEIKFIRHVNACNKFSGEGSFNIKCSEFIKQELQCREVFLTPSGTHALEMAAILADIKTGDEVIMPSFTFPSSANAFALRGAKIVFVDINPATMNIDENLIENAISEKTKAILVVHYGSVACKMDKIVEISRKHELVLIEDAAQAYKAKYKDKFLGTIGDIGCISFHETKNIHCGEGGAILINNAALTERAEIIREKGTNRNKFYRGEVDKYTWIDIGSSFLLSELNAAFLYAQLINADIANNRRRNIFQQYENNLTELVNTNKIELAQINASCQPNGHLFYLKAKDISERGKLIKYLKNNSIQTCFHYVPLHSSPAGKSFGIFHKEDKYTTAESERLLRLPVFFKLKDKEVDKITDAIKRFYFNIPS
ncbi:MAG: dTDP-4-amino-4,6-dideoxygalactose transaminase [Bacteroidales bacterium]|jgi:dTDP-4-amino-4,6-dideoxygalactose transaminase